MKKIYSLILLKLVIFDCFKKINSLCYSESIDNSDPTKINDEEKLVFYFIILNFVAMSFIFGTAILIK